MNNEQFFTYRNNGTNDILTKAPSAYGLVAVESAHYLMINISCCK